MNSRLSIPGPRSLIATHDDRDSDAVVVACPPHPQMRGDRHDSRLTAVSDELADAGVDCLRFDYGPWDDGRGERVDARQALSWARERYDHVGLFGFSFGGGMALLASVPERDEPTPDVVSALAPASQVTDGTEISDALDAIECPVQVLYGERDETAVWKPVVERARTLDCQVDSLPADHFFVGQQQKAATQIAAFQSETLRDSSESAGQI